MQEELPTVYSPARANTPGQEAFSIFIPSSELLLQLSFIQNDVPQHHFPPCEKKQHVSTIRSSSPRKNSHFNFPN